MDQLTVFSEFASAVVACLVRSAPPPPVIRPAR